METAAVEVKPQAKAKAIINLMELTILLIHGTSYFNFRKIGSELDPLPAEEVDPLSADEQITLSH